MYTPEQLNDLEQIRRLRCSYSAFYDSQRLWELCSLLRRTPYAAGMHGTEVHGADCLRSAATIWNVSGCTPDTIPCFTRSRII